MDSLTSIDKNEAFKILTRIASGNVEVSFKLHGSNKIYNTVLEKNIARKQFYLTGVASELDISQEATIKIILDRKLYFLKTNLKKATVQYYFENYDHFFELVRRKKPRFVIPEHWAQTAKIQALYSPVEIKSPASIIDLSRTGMRLQVKAEIPRYEVNQIVNLYFKVYRRAEMLIKSKIIHLRPTSESGPIIGLEYADNSILIANKVQNICDDLAFYWTSESD